MMSSSRPQEGKRRQAGIRRLTVVPSGGRVGTSAVGTGATLHVGELARAAGKTVRAIHLYESMGLLSPTERSAKGHYRLFAPEALHRVKWISKLQSLGIQLAEIQGIVEEQERAGSAHFAAAKLRDVYVGKLTETREKLAALRTLEAELEESLRFLDGCQHLCEPRAASTSCSWCERQSETAPELVVGVRSQ